MFGGQPRSIFHPRLGVLVAALLAACSGAPEDRLAGDRAGLGEPSVGPNDGQPGSNGTSGDKAGTSVHPASDTPGLESATATYGSDAVHTVARVTIERTRSLDEVELDEPEAFVEVTPHDAESLPNPESPVDAEGEAAGTSSDGEAIGHDGEAELDPATDHEGSLFDGEAEPLTDPAPQDPDASANVTEQALEASHGHESLGSANAQAMAHFVRVTPKTRSTLQLVGLQAVIPGINECRVDFEPTPTALDELAEIDLLAAGDVEIVPELDRLLERLEPAERAAAKENAIVTLVPHAFPSVSSFASGLVYTTRDRSEGALPSNVHYTVLVGGSEHVPLLRWSGPAPAELTEVTLGGEPLVHIEELTNSHPLDLTWKVGSPGDLVYVEAARIEDGEILVGCTFADDAGSGTIAQGFLAGEEGAIRLGIHRVRTVDASRYLADERGERIAPQLRFDFEVHRIVNMQSGAISVE